MKQMIAMARRGNNTHVLSMTVKDSEKYNKSLKKRKKEKNKMEKNTIEIKNKINKLYEEAANIRADISYYRTGFSFYVSTDALEEKLHKINVEIATLERELAEQSGTKVRTFFG